MRYTSFVIALLVSAACSRSPSEPPPPADPSPTTRAGSPASAAPQPPNPRAAPPPAPPSQGAHPSALALRWDDPSRWTRRPPSTPMRQAEYLVPRATGDSEDGECSVITFGPGQGGTIDENVERWVKQLEPTASKVERAKRVAGGLTITRVEVAGTYTPMQVGGKPSSGPKPGYRLIGEIVEAPSGLWFFKLVGPDATVKAAGKELDALVDSAHTA
jgi:hypothetical protein